MSWHDGINHFYQCFFRSGSSVLLLWPCCSLLARAPSRHQFFSLYSQPCGPEHTLHLIREYYLSLGGQHSSTSQGFCQPCISLSGCPPSPFQLLQRLHMVQYLVWSVPLQEYKKTASLSRFFSLYFLLMWPKYITSSMSWYRFNSGNIHLSFDALLDVASNTLVVWTKS